MNYSSKQTHTHICVYSVEKNLTNRNSVYLI